MNNTTNTPSLGYHILAFITIFVWGTTFASSKVLLSFGLTPGEIMLYRFGIAYMLSWFFSRQLWCNNIVDELFLVLAGFTGGTMYFLAENTALQYTITSNIALIVCSAPVLTALLAIMCFKSDRLTSKLVYGSLIAMTGMALIILNGKILKFNPIGDSLAFLAALAWAIYSVVLRRFDGRYSMWMVTRKIFLYGIVTLIPFIAFSDEPLHLDALTHPVVIGNMLFLGVVASLLCFYSWNVVMEKIGTIRSSNYLYSQPIVSLVCSVVILDEPLTSIAIVGTIFILCGIYVAQNGFKLPKRG